MKVVRITVDDGKAEVKVEGCTGPACEALTADLEAALGERKANARTADYARQEARAVATVKRG